MIKLTQLIKESEDSIIERFISLLPKYDLEFHSWDIGREHAFQWRGNTYPTITDKEKIVKVALDRTDLFVRRPGEVWVGDPSRPLLNGYVIQAIITDPQHRGKGKASEILKRMLKAADEAGLLLKLEAVPMKSFIKRKQPKLSQPQLIKWYSKHGFEKHPESSLMVRKPKQPLSEEYDPETEFVLDKRPIIMVRKLVETFLKELEPLKKALGFKNIRIHFITHDPGGLARYIHGTKKNPHFVMSTRVIYYAAKKYGANLGVAIFTTLVHEFCHAYLDSVGINPWDHDEDLVEEVARDYQDDSNIKKLKEKLDLFAKNPSLHYFAKRHKLREMK
jgi:GNAT superfamily N-acetyltransferase